SLPGPGLSPESCRAGLDRLQAEDLAHRRSSEQPHAGIQGSLDSSPGARTSMPNGGPTPRVEILPGGLINSIRICSWFSRARLTARPLGVPRRSIGLEIHPWGSGSQRPLREKLGIVGPAPAPARLPQRPVASPRVVAAPPAVCADARQ